MRVWVVLVLLLFVGCTSSEDEIKIAPNIPVTANFEECAKYYPVMESHPMKCRDEVSGETFTQVIDETQQPSSELNITRTNTNITRRLTGAAFGVRGDIDITSSFIDIVDTGQDNCYDTNKKITCPSAGQSFYGQDANYQGVTPAYQDNGDETITDLNTDLMWTKKYFGKVTFDEGPEYAKTLEVGGYGDWRVPAIKELYSLMDFSGTTGSGGSQSDNTPPDDAVPYIDTGYFEFAYGLEDERYIDSQWLTTAKYVSTTMNGDETMFGVNFADGRIKGYGFYNPSNPRIGKKFYARFVRGNSYGENKFVDNKDDTITDQSTGLMWTKKDNGHYDMGHAEYGGLNWQEALEYCEELSIANYNDWRLPNAKELQGIVDYTKSPDTTNSAAIDSLFAVTSITDEGGNKNYPFYWTGTTHLEGKEPASGAVYIAFGEALGYMNGNWLDVHGAGAQRSDPKAGDPKEYPNGHGPQGDAIRIYNFVRCVRG